MRTKSNGSRRPRRWILVVVAVSALVAAACSATGAEPSAALESGSPAPSPAASAPPSAAATASAESGGGRGDYGYETTPSEAPVASSPATTGVTVNVASGPLGDYLTGAGDLTLYTFKPDSSETSTCEGGCAEAWPPFTVDQGAEPAAGDGVEGTLSTFTRADGTLQVAYNGAPLYYFANDTTAGDTNGQGLGNNWFIVKP